MAYAREVYQVTDAAGQDLFDVPFDYLSKDHVLVTVNGVATTAFSWVNDTRIQLDTAAALADVIIVSRESSPGTRLVDYQTGSTLSEEILDQDSLQGFYLAQEANDVKETTLNLNGVNQWEAEGKLIQNLADPVDFTDAVTKNYLENQWLTTSDKAQLNALEIPKLNRVYTSIDEIDRVYTSADNIDRVHTSIAKVDRVHTSIGNVDRVFTSIDNVDRVDQSITNVDRVATSADNLDRVHTSIANVDRVDQSIDNVDRVSTSADNLDRVHTSIAKVDRVYTSIDNIDDVAADLNDPAGSDIDIVAGSITNVNKTGADITSVVQVATDIADVRQVASDTVALNSVYNNIGAVTNVNTNMSAVTNVSTNMAAVTNVSNNMADIQAVEAQVQKVVEVANDLQEATSEIDTVANSIANVDAVGQSIGNVNIAAQNLTNINNFADTYSIGATAPTAPTTGDLWFDTTASTMKVYDGNGFVNAGSSVNGVANSVEYTATAGQTSFAATYDAGYVDVYLNGVKLAATDFTATDGSNVVLATGATAGDTVFIQSFGTFTISDVYNKSESDARYMPIDEVTLPDQTGHAGQYLTTDGTTADWADVPPAVTSDIHVFYVDANGDLIWEHGNTVTDLQDANGNDLYDVVIVGSSDQTYAVDQTTGNLQVTIG